jgi:hypothetical protein
MVSVRPARSGFFPLDEELQLLPGRLTPRLQESLVRLGTWIPSFAKAAAELAWFTQVEVSKATACRLTEAAGAAAVAVQTREVERIEREYPSTPPGPETLLFSVDGAMVPLVHGQWAEVRTLAVAAVAPPVRRDGAVVIQTHDLSYFSRLADSTTFSRLALGELHRRGIATARRVGAVVDGADWCQSFIDLHAPEAVRILDFPHAAGYVSAIGQLTGPNGRLLSEQEVSRLLHALKHTSPRAVLAELRTLTAAHPDLPDLGKSLAYLTKRAAHLQYPAFQAAGWPIGSGMVESANKLVVEARLKGAGMHWAEAHVNPLLALRNAVCNDRWAEVWKQIEREQRQQTALRRLERQQRRPHAAPAPPVGEPVAPLSHPPALMEPASAGDCDQPATNSVPAGEQRRPAASHPWKRAWSVRRQRELVPAA